MRKIILTGLQIFFVLSILAQEQFDVRKTKWGMTMDEVINSESPLVPTKNKYDEHSIQYEYVELSNGSSANINYFFGNDNKLNEIIYAVYGFAPYIGTCTKIIPLYTKIMNTSSVFASLKSKGFVCAGGWRLYYSDGYHPFVNTTCAIDKETVTKIDEEAKKNNYSRIELCFVNNRTFLSFSFNEHQNMESVEKNKYTELFPCENRFWYTYFWIHFEPKTDAKPKVKIKDF